MIRKTNKMEREFIICAAIWINDGETYSEQPENIKEGFVVCGRRHNNCYATIKAISKMSVNESIGKFISGLSDNELRKHQGFVTSLDRYVDRKEGWEIAKREGQIQYGLKCSDNGDDSILISENLY